MIEYAYADLFLKDSVDKQWIIECSNGITLTNSDLEKESIRLTEKLCSDSELVFGRCETSEIEFTTRGIVESLVGCTITVKIVLDNHTEAPFIVGTYTVFSDKPAIENSARTVTAYDAMYDINNADVCAWYDALTFPMTLKQFRDSLFNHLGIAQEVTTLPNDSLQVTKNIDISGGYLCAADLVFAICEINGCFGHIGRDNKFKYIYLRSYHLALFPRNNLYPANDLYPMDDTYDGKVDRAYYKSTDYEDYKVSKIDKLVIKDDEDEVGGGVGSGMNGYIISGNFFAFDFNSSQFQTVAQNIMNKWNEMIEYRPITCDAVGNPCLEVGDGFRVSGPRAIAESYILQRTLTGIQFLNDTYEAAGEEFRTENTSGMGLTIAKLNGKTNRLSRSIDELSSEISDVDQGLSSRITQNANAIATEVTRATNAEGTLSSRITQTADSISSEVTRATNAEGNLSSRITQTANSITSEVTRATNAEGNLSSRITQTADSISSEVTRAQGAESNLSSRITQNATAIEARVTKTGGTQSSFAWSLTDSEFALWSGNNKVFSCTSGGITVNGYASVGSLNSVSGRVGSLESDHVSVDSLNAVSGRVGNLEADHVSTTTITSMNATIRGKLDADQLNATNINSLFGTTTAFSANNVHVNSTLSTQGLYYGGHQINTYSVKNTAGATIYALGYMA